MATITTTNQKPCELVSFHTGSIAGTFDPFDTVEKSVIASLFTPLIPGTPVSIDCDGKPMTTGDITQTLFDCCGEQINVPVEELMKDIFSQTLTWYDRTLSVEEVYSAQAGKKLQLLMPQPPRVTYVPLDVIDAAKQFIAGQLNRDGFFANLAFYTRIKAFGYYFANDAAWSAFKTFFMTEVNNIQNLLSPDTIQLCQKLQAMSLNRLTEGFVLRDDETQNNDPYSFARLFPFYLMAYERQCRTQCQPEYMAGHMPFSVSENFCPTTIILVNVEKHAHANANEIKQEWDIITNAMAMKPKVLGNNQIANLTAAVRMSAKIQGHARARQDADMHRSAIIRFRNTPPTSVDLYKYIIKIYKRAQFVQQSENAVRNIKTTYNRPSRRDPDNPDRQGKTPAISFKPDLHVYLDCSGSITEREYQDAMKTIIKLAKRLGINLYFNSFSDYMSQSTKLPVKGKTLREIYDIFRNIPKVAGGTDYEQIWHYINKSQKLLKEVSVIISDFEWRAPNHYVKHPPFLFYAPISTNNWKKIVRAATDFTKSMLNTCPEIRKRIMM